MVDSATGVKEHVCCVFFFFGGCVAFFLNLNSDLCIIFVNFPRFDFIHPLQDRGGACFVSKQL